MTDAAIVKGLAQSKLATELTATQSEALAASMTVRDLEQGEVLVHEGDTDDHLYVVLAGSLGVVKAARTDNELTLNVMRPGDVVGELSFLDGATRFASLVAMAETRVLGLSRGDLEALLDRDPQLVYRIMRAIVRIVHDIQRRLSMQTVELTNYLYKTHGRY
ncbi:MAG TPA: cyclic nucleotide-binding domain-containing protein [Steroidobacteraceae bacterium]|jgi:CRP/FNR family cyclic AMP-dependent transcriptional regulator|nr:cyclic nucleotide-binding domain-containing protein [Steroidobacteraceae bacterium]